MRTVTPMAHSCNCIVGFFICQAQAIPCLSCRWCTILILDMVVAWTVGWGDTCAATHASVQLWQCMMTMWLSDIQLRGVLQCCQALHIILYGAAGLGHMHLTSAPDGGATHPWACCAGPSGALLQHQPCCVVSCLNRANPFFVRCLPLGQWSWWSNVQHLPLLVYPRFCPKGVTG